LGMRLWKPNNIEGSDNEGKESNKGAV